MQSLVTLRLITPLTAMIAGRTITGIRCTVVIRSGAKLCRLLVEPLIDALPETVEELIIIPAGVLSRLPFEALVLDAPEKPGTDFGEVAFVLDRFRVTYGPSTPAFPT